MKNLSFSLPLALVSATLVTLITVSASAQMVPFIPGLSANGHLLLALGNGGGGESQSNENTTQHRAYMPKISKFGRCAVIAPEGKTYADEHCSSETAYGVTYENEFIGANPCYPSASEADTAMKALPFCNLKPKTSECKILFPKQRDYGDRFCKTGYAVTLNGYLESDACYPNVIDAFKRMATVPVCDASGLDSVLEDRSCAGELRSYLLTQKDRIQLESACLEISNGKVTKQLKTAREAADVRYDRALKACAASREPAILRLIQGLPESRESIAKSSVCGQKFKPSGK